MKREVTHVVRRRFPLVEGAGYYVRHDPVGEVSGEPLVIATGYLGLPIDYEELADELARHGRAVVVPCLATPLPGEPHDDPLRYRLATLERAMEDTHVRFGDDIYSTIGHSFGGPTQAQLAAESPYAIAHMNYLAAIGFDNVGHDLRHIAAFALKELLPSLYRHITPRHIGRRALEVASHAGPHDAWLRREELRVIKNMGMFNTPYIQQANDSGVVSTVLGGPADHLADWSKTVEAVQGLVEGGNVRTLHERAHHLVAQAFARRVARSILGEVDVDLESAA